MADKHRYEERTFTFRQAVAGMGRIIAHVAEFRKEFILLCCMGFFAAFLEPIATYLFSRIVYAVTTTGANFDPLREASIYLVLWAIVAFTSLSFERMNQLRGKILDEKAKVKFFIKVNDFILRLPLSFHKSTNAGALWDKINRGANAIVDLFSNAIIPLAPQVVSIVVMLVISFFINWVFGLLFLGGALLYLFSIARSAIPNATLQRKMQLNYSIARAHASDSFANVRAVKDFTAEEHEHAKSVDLFEKQGLAGWVSYITHMIKSGFWQRSIIFCTRFLSLILSLYFIFKGTMTIADLVLLNAYVGNIFSPLSQVSSQWRSVQNGIIALEDVEEVMREIPETYAPAGNPKEIELLGGVRFDSVSFSYEAGQQILDKVSFEAKPGEIIAFVGESGVGKSTSMDLLMAYHFATEGSVSLDGKDIRTLPLKSLRSQIAVVPQETVLFNDTVRANLRYGNFSATDAEIEEAAKRAHCYDFIMKFPTQWESKVGERGLKLSVGQKQRISIARALLRNPRILILDEPTSALDAGTEKIITESLEKLMDGRTTFIIAHRLSTVRRADKILVFKEGRIIESGKHDELLAKKGGEYRRLYELQIGLHA